MDLIPSPRLGFLRGVFLVNHLASTDNIARTNKGQNTQQRKLTIHKKGLYIAFVDLEKTFDREPREVIRWALRKAGVDE